MPKKLVTLFKFIWKKNKNLNFLSFLNFFSELRNYKNNF